MGSKQSQLYRQQIEDEFNAIEREKTIQEEIYINDKHETIIDQPANIQLPISRIFSRNPSYLLLPETGPLSSSPLSKNSTFCFDYDEIRPTEKVNYLYSSSISVEVDDWSISAALKFSNKVIIL